MIRQSNGLEVQSLLGAQMCSRVDLSGEFIKSHTIRMIVGKQSVGQYATSQNVFRIQVLGNKYQVVGGTSVCNGGEGSCACKEAHHIHGHSPHAEQIKVTFAHFAISIHVEGKYQLGQVIGVKTILQELLWHRNVYGIDELIPFQLIRVFAIARRSIFHNIHESLMASILERFVLKRSMYVRGQVR